MGTRPTHPILLYFGDTAKIDLPVVLMIGREPNTHHQIVPGAGPYDFREYPRAGFWNIAYGVVAESVGSTGGKLKRACIRRKASPILFANSLPIGIKSFIVNKLPERGTRYGHG